MAKKELSIQAYADSIGVTRGTIYRWLYEAEARGDNKLKKGVTFKKVVGHYVIVVSEVKKKVVA